MTRKQRLLAINTPENLKQPNICRLQWVVFLAGFLKLKLKPKYIVGIQVTYKDKIKKVIDINYWCIFRGGILTNLYVKGLCKIKFNTSFENKLQLIDDDALKNAEKLLHKLRGTA